MSRPLEAESYVCVFDPFLKTLQITAQYTNHTGTPAKVVSSLAMQEGMRIVDSWADVHGYKQDRKFMPNEQAEAECKALSASSNKGGARQIASKFALDHQTDVPAFAPGMGPDRAPATFAVTFVVAFTDVEEHALRLPEENHQPAREVSDFAVQVPPISGSGRVGGKVGAHEGGKAVLLVEGTEVVRGHVFLISVLVIHSRHLSDLGRLVVAEREGLASVVRVDERRGTVWVLSLIHI